MQKWGGKAHSRPGTLPLRLPQSGDNGPEGMLDGPHYRVHADQPGSSAS